MKTRRMALIAGLALGLLLVGALWQAGEAARGAASSLSDNRGAPAASNDTAERATADGMDLPIPLSPSEAADRSRWSPKPSAATQTDEPAEPGHLAVESDCLGHPITMNGTAGDDYLVGTPGNDVIHGQAGNDILRGGGGNDIICGGEGDDGLNGDAGDDTLDGGAGYDGLGGGEGNDTLSGGPGLDWVDYYTAPGPLTLSLATGTATGEGNDTLLDIEAAGGSRFDDVLTAGPFPFGSGLSGGDGNDIIHGGDENDGLWGDAGNDILDGGPGDDALGGGDGHDSASGGAGIDDLWADGGNGTLDGGPDWDWVYYYSAPGPVTLSFATGTASGDGSDTLLGIEGAMGSDFDDVLTAGPSGNSLGGVGGNDTLIGGEGRDTAGYWWAPGGVTVDLAAGTASGQGNDTLTGIESVVGSMNYDDVLAGDGGDNSLSGFGGNDASFGREGDDFLYDQEGDDNLDGGPGTDYLAGGAGTDTCLNGESLRYCELPTSISGTVTDEASGDPLSDICVSVSGDYWAESITDASGHYRIGSLPSGDYRVQFRDCRLTVLYISEYYDDKPDWNSADLVPVTLGSVIGGVDAALAVGGSISGTVTDEASGDPLSDICVYASGPSYGPAARTDSSGQYTVGGLPSGNYRVEFNDCRYPVIYVTEYYDDQPDRNSADLVPVTQGAETTGIDAALVVGGLVSGTVTDEATGDPIQGIYLSISSESGGSWAETDSSGHYTVGGLHSGDYRVRFYDSGPTAIYITEWYDDKSDWDSADLVSVTLGAETDGIDAALAVGGSISGTVTDDATGDPLGDISVEVSSGFDTWYGYTDSSGYYRVGGLPTGDYKVQFRDGWSSTATYVSEWYDDKLDWSSADPVSIAQGSETSGIDAALVVGGSITGTVIDEVTGDPLSGICLEVHSESVGLGVGTDSSGNYRVGGLPAGDYKVEFRDCYWDTYVTEWYDDKPDEYSADLVSVALGSETDGINAALAVGGSISGTVTDEATGELLSDICVYASGPSYPPAARTDALGRYGIAVLPSGDYRVRFIDCHSSATYATEWYDDKQDFDSADPVAVVAGSETGAIDAALAVGGSISGTVTDEATGDALSDVCVNASDPSQSWGGSGQSDSNGQYTIGGLPGGDYEVYFWDCSYSRNYVSEWYDNQPDWSSADLIAVTEGLETGGIDAALALGGSISGTVTDEGTGDPIPGICVSASYGADAVTDSSGHYVLGGLSAGDYVVSFADCHSTVIYAWEYYDDKHDWDSADPVPVALGSETGGIDAALAVGGSISGTVTDDATGDPLESICVNASYIGGGRSGRTDSGGHYIISGLPSANYKVQFRDCEWPGTYAPEWYDNKPDSDSADPVPVSLGSETAGIDAALAVGGSISGTVTDESTGNPLPGTCVSVSGASQGSTVATDSSGNYSVEGLAGGVFKVEFFDCVSPFTYVFEWYDNKPDYQSADPVSVTLGSETSGIDAALSPGSGQPDLIMTKAANPPEATVVAQGTLVYYTLTVANSASATAAATNVAIRDTLGAGLSLFSVTASAGVTCSDLMGPDIDCSAASIAPGESRTVQVAAVVTVASGFVLNGARVDPDNVIAEGNEDADDPALDCAVVGEDIDVVPDTEPDNFDCTSHSVGGALDLILTKTASPTDGSTVSNGGTITYTLTASATGAAASNVIIRDTLGTGLTLLSITPAPGAAGNGVVCADVTGPNYDCTAASIPSGESRTVTVVASVSATSGSVPNGAAVDPTDVVAEANEDGDDPSLACAVVGEWADVGAPTEPDNFDCTSHSVGPAATVRVRSAGGGPGSSVVVRLEALDIPSPGLGATTVDVLYDPAVVDAIACAADPGDSFDTALCSVAYQPNAVRLTAISASGVAGDAALADITFLCLGEVGECSNLDVQVVTFADPDGNPIAYRDEDGEICVGLCGDADSDGDVDAVDALFVLQYVVGLRQGDNTCQAGTGVICLPSSDVDCDGDVDAVDALFILQNVVGIRPVLCSCSS